MFGYIAIEVGITIFIISHSQLKYNVFVFQLSHILRQFISIKQQQLCAGSDRLFRIALVIFLKGFGIYSATIDKMYLLCYHISGKLSLDDILNL